MQVIYILEYTFQTGLGKDNKSTRERRIAIMCGLLSDIDVAEHAVIEH